MTNDKVRCKTVVLPLVGALTVFFFVVNSFAAQEKTPDEIIAKHLDSIGTAQARDALSSRVVEGRALYKVLVGGSGSIEGKGVLVSQGAKLHLLFKVNTVEYRGEMFIFDGSKSYVAGSYADKTRSELGEFMYTQDGLLRGGVLGSTLSTAWPLLNPDEWKGKVKYEGLKKVDGRELCALHYKLRKSDLDTTLYFDPENYNHVLTISQITLNVGIGTRGETSSSRRQQARYRVEERYANFQSADGLTTPRHYELRYTLETEDGFTKSVEWDLDVARVVNNVPLDPKNFAIP